MKCEDTTYFDDKYVPFRRKSVLYLRENDGHVAVQLSVVITSKQKNRPSYRTEPPREHVFTLNSSAM